MILTAASLLVVEEVAKADNTNTLLTFLLGGGLAAALGALFKGIRSLQSGTRAREREAIIDLGEWRADEHDARVLAERDTAYWQSRCNDYIGQLLRNQLQPEPLPEDLIPPSRREEGKKDEPKQRRRTR